MHCMLNRTWDLVKLPTNKQAIASKWIYKVKHKADSSIETFNARLMVKVYTQHLEIDYTEPYSPVFKMTTVRTLVAVVWKSVKKISKFMSIMNFYMLIFMKKCIRKCLKFLM